jgi:integrase
MYPIEKKEPRYITREEFERFVKLLPEHQQPIARFCVMTGVRMRNATHLQWDKVDLAARAIWIQASRSKNKKPLSIPLNVEAMAVIKAQLGKHPKRVFTYEGQPVDRLYTKAWRKAAEKAGTKGFRVHDLRHTWASWHVMSGTPLHVLQELGEWSSIQMVQCYAHLSHSHLREHAESVASSVSLSQEDLSI